ncbi:MAG: methyltransferase [Candidatus Binatia bacterium]
MTQGRQFSALAKLASGHVEAQIVQTAVKLGIFDAIGDGAAHAQTVAATLGLEQRATELMLNALTALRLTKKTAARFSLTKASSRYLRRSAPEYLGGMILFDASLWRCWEHLPDTVRTGKPARPANMYQEDPEETAIFISAMDSLVKARGDTDILAKAYDWEAVTELLDIGSGPATYPISLCRKYPNLKATIFDLPATLKITEEYVREAGLQQRIRLMPGDYRIDDVSGSYDVVFLSNIIHGESYKQNQNLIRKLYPIVEPRGHIIIKDHILEDSRTNPPVGALFSLLMLLTTDSGRCYGFDEVKSWMDSAGFKEIQQIDLPAPLNSSLVLGKR